MVIRMPGSLDRLQHPAPEVDLVTVAERVDTLLGEGIHAAPQSFHVVSVDPGRACPQLGGIDEVGRPHFVHADPRVGPAVCDRSRATRVIEMDVRDENPIEVGYPQVLEPGEDLVRAGLRPRLYQCRLIGVDYERPGDAVVAVHPRVDDVESNHFAESTSYG